MLEQDSDAEIVNCVELIASVPLGSLIDEPSFGVTDPTFMLNPPARLIAAQISSTHVAGAQAGGVLMAENVGLAISLPGAVGMVAGWHGALLTFLAVVVATLAGHAYRPARGGAS